MKRERSPVLAQVQRKEVAALATLPISKRVLIVVGEVSLKEVVDVAVEVEDGARPLAMQRTPDERGRHGAVVVGLEDKCERPEALLAQQRVLVPRIGGRSSRSSDARAAAGVGGGATAAQDCRERQAEATTTRPRCAGHINQNRNV